MIRRRVLAILFVGGLAAGAASLATSASAASIPPLDGFRTALVRLDGGKGTAAVGTPVAGATAGIGGQVSAVSGSTYTIAGPQGSSLTIDATSSTTYVNADGSPADASAVKTGVFITAEGTLSNDGKTLTAQRITVGRPQGVAGRGLISVSTSQGGFRTDLGTLPTPPDGATAGIGGQVSAVSGSTYTIAGPSGSSVTIDTTNSTTYVNADGSSADASAVKTGVFIAAEGTFSNQGKTLTAQRITIGAPQGGVTVNFGGGQDTAPVLR